MRRKLLVLFLAVSLFFAIAWTPPTAECFACTQADKNACLSQSTQALNDCFNIWGSQLGMVYCPQEEEYVYVRCMQSKGCPVNYSKWY